MKEFTKGQDFLVQRYKKFTKEQRKEHMDQIKKLVEQGWGYFIAVKKAGFAHEYGVYLRKMDHAFDNYVLNHFDEKHQERFKR